MLITFKIVNNTNKAILKPFKRLLYSFGILILKKIVDALNLKS